MSLEILRELYEVIRDRRKNPVDGSYTCKLFTEGLDKILKKVGEEAVELVIAGKSRDRGQVVYEAADLLYHMMVLLVYEGIELEEVLEELERRRGKRRDH
ncbi:MAG: phosphoribosyl-ATP diphosphatase [Thaumarchaeota archaeon]|jgi:phosphoribosyl-ATP pyrophosphohydrolase|nr:phosphoribosyl-ATP diphosphatase [Candidatus Wolframiiraptor allenii]